MKLAVVVFPLGLCVLGVGAAGAYTIVSNDPGVALTGIVRFDFSALSGSTSGVSLVGIGDTGLISFNLDPSKTSFVQYDFVNGQESESLYLVLNCGSGLGSASIVINESGPITQVLRVASGSSSSASFMAAFSGTISGAMQPPLATSGSLSGTTNQALLTSDFFDVFSSVSGGGTVTEGVFSGLTLSDDENHGLHIAIGLVPQPYGPTNPPPDTGGPHPAPEPASAMLIGIALAGSFVVLRGPRIPNHAIARTRLQRAAAAQV